MSERVDVQQLRDQIDWYRRCLENAYAGVAVRGLAEARAGYESALPALFARLDALEKVAAAAREVIAYGTNGGDEWRRVAANLADALAGVPGEAGQKAWGQRGGYPAGSKPASSLKPPPSGPAAGADR